MALEIRLDVYTAIKESFKDVEGKISFIEFPAEDEDKLDPIFGPPRMRMIIERQKCRYLHDFELSTYHWHLERGSFDRQLDRMKKEIEKAFKDKLKTL